MSDIKTKVKQKVLQEIMDLMDENMLGDLKSKSPKMAALEIETKKSDESPLDELESESEVVEARDDEPAIDSEEDDVERLKELWSKLR